MKFPYVKFSGFYRPVIPIILVYQNNQLPYQALLDTGADLSIIHAEIAEVLGIKVTSGTKHYFGGVTGQGGRVYSPS